MTPQVAVGAIAIQDDSLLLVRRGRGPAAGEWSIPGGRVESGELLAAAVVREFAEETGLQAVVGRFVDWVERIGDDHHFVILDFEVAVMSDGDPVAGSDAAEAKWVPLTLVPEYRLVDGLAEFLADCGYIDTLT